MNNVEGGFREVLTFQLEPTDSGAGLMVPKTNFNAVQSRFSSKVLFF